MRTLCGAHPAQAPDGGVCPGPFTQGHVSCPSSCDGWKHSCVPLQPWRLEVQSQSRGLNEVKVGAGLVLLEAPGESPCSWPFSSSRGACLPRLLAPSVHHPLSAPSSHLPSVHCSSAHGCISPSSAFVSARPPPTCQIRPPPSQKDPCDDPGPTQRTPVISLDPKLIPPAGFPYKVTHARVLGIWPLPPRPPPRPSSCSLASCLRALPPFSLWPSHLWPLCVAP